MLSLPITNKLKKNKNAQRTDKVGTLQLKKISNDNKIVSEILPEVNVFVKAIETISPTDFISQNSDIEHDTDPKPIVEI